MIGSNAYRSGWFGIALLAAISANTAYAHEPLGQFGSGPIESVGWSADGSRYLVGGSLGYGVWDSAVHEKIGFVAHGAGRAAISPDGNLVVSGNQLSDAATGRTIRTFGDQEPLGVAFSPDGSKLAIGAPNGIASIWDVGTGALLREFEGHNSVQSVAFSPDGTELLTGGDTTAKLWNTATGELIRTFVGQSAVANVSFSPDGTRIVTGGGNAATIWNKATGDQVRTLTHGGFPTPVVNYTALLPDGQRLLTGSTDGVQVWDLNTVTVTRFFDHEDRVTPIALSPDGDTVLVGTSTGTLWDVETEGVLPLASHSVPVRSLALSGNGSRLVTGASAVQGRSEAVVWDTATGAALRSFTFESFSPAILTGAVGISRDGSTVLLPDHEGGAGLWNVATGVRLIQVSPLPEGTPTVNGALPGVWSVAYESGNSFVTGSGNGVVKRWTALGVQIMEAEGLTEGVRGLAFSPDRQRLVGVSKDKGIVWDSMTGEPLHSFTPVEAMFNSVDYSPDGTHILTANSLGKVEVRDATGALVSFFDTNQTGKNAFAATYSPNGRLVAVASEDGTTTLWDPTEGQQVRSFAGETIFRDALFSPDGSILYTASDSHIARTWDATGMPLLLGEEESHPYLAGFDSNNDLVVDAADLVQEGG